LYNLRSLSILTQKIVVEISGSGSDIRSTPTPTNYTYLRMILELITLFVRLYSVYSNVAFCRCLTGFGYGVWGATPVIKDVKTFRLFMVDCLLTYYARRNIIRV
jgi:hypothetical protein